MRYYDKLPPEIIEGFVEQQPFIFDVSNVFRLYFQRSSDDQIEFPNLAPPYPCYWMEAQAPPWLSLEGQRTNWIGPPEWGVLFNASDYFDSLGRRLGWAMSATLYAHAMGRTQPWYRIQYLLDERGSRMAIDTNKFYHITRLISGAPFGENMTEAECDMAVQYLGPFLWATCFLHCKNIEITKVAPSPKQSNAFSRLSGRPLVRFHTLSISPGWRQGVGGPAGAGNNRALHICRGHFKQFDEKPLFGKYAGLFWWEAQVRGNKKHGTIIKDYKINPPTIGREACP